MTVFAADVADTPDNPFAGGVLRADSDAGLRVVDGVIVDRGPVGAIQARYPDDEIVDLRGGLLLPGLVDAHVHFPQVRAIGALGRPLMDWLEHCALPEEERLAEVTYAQAIAQEFVRALIEAGTTTALVFGAHFAAAVDVLFTAAAKTGLRITSGLVVSDRLLRPALHTTPQRSYAEGRALAQRWHEVQRQRYAVIPRFSLSCSDDLLASCAALHDDVVGSWFTSHINENEAEIATVHDLFGGVSYLDTYAKHGLVGRRSVFAHNVHPTEAELEQFGPTGASVAHCPTSNAALGSGLFPLARHLAAGVPVALGSDVGAGTGFSLFKEGLQAYFVQQLRGDDGVLLSAAHLLHLATAAGADALGLRDSIGDLSVGKRFDAVWVRPPDGSVLAASLRHAPDIDAALARVFALATSSDVAGVWVDGARIKDVDA